MHHNDAEARGYPLYPLRPIPLVAPPQPTPQVLASDAFQADKDAVKAAADAAVTADVAVAAYEQ